MRDPVLAALRSKLATYESAGLDDLAKRVKARIAKLEKAAKSEPVEVSPPKKPSELVKPSSSAKKFKES